MSTQTSLAAQPTSPVLPNIPIRLLATTPPPIPAPTATPVVPWLYGPPGRTVRVGLWRLLKPRLDTPRYLLGESPLQLSARGAPESDYAPFRDMGAATVADLLNRLPAVTLNDCQNLVPSLKTMLTACAGADGQVCLYDYGIDSQREDERLSAKALWAAGTDLQGYEALVERSRGCQCSALWERIRDRYELDTGCIPDDIVRTRPK